MPCRLTNAPTIFQALVNYVLGDFLDLFVFVYLDNILVFSPDLDTHQNHVRQVLQWLLENHLYVKVKNCVFHSTSGSFLGFVVGEGTVSMDLGKVQAVQDWPAPETRKQLQCFLSFTNFYHGFIKNFSSIAASLHTLTSSQSYYLKNDSAEADF